MTIWRVYLDNLNHQLLSLYPKIVMYKKYVLSIHFDHISNSYKINSFLTIEQIIPLDR